jgi:hypothetical protein
MPGLLESAGSSFGSSVGSAAGDFVGSIFGNRQTTEQNTSQSGTRTQQKILTPEAINKLIYDVMSSDNGLAQLATGEKGSGGSLSSTKSLMAQDLITKLVGELAGVTAQNVTTESAQSNSNSTSKKKSSVICSELNRQGYIENGLYARGQRMFLQEQSFYTILGYQLMAGATVSKMENDKPLCLKMLKWVSAYYFHKMYNAPSLRSIAILYVARPVAYIRGLAHILASYLKSNGSEDEHAGT